METKSFDLGAVLSVTTGYLLTDIDNVIESLTAGRQDKI
jgi:hypothetical protein